MKFADFISKRLAKTPQGYGFVSVITDPDEGAQSSLVSLLRSQDQKLQIFPSSIISEFPGDKILSSAERFLNQGAHVVLTLENQDQLKELASGLEEWKERSLATNLSTNPKRKDSRLFVVVHNTPQRDFTTYIKRLGDYVFVNEDQAIN